MKRNIRRPEGFNGEEVKGYFMIANQDAAIAIVNKLTGSQLRLWLYLMVIDSFADTTADGEKVYHKIPSPAEIAIKIGVSPSTVEKDMRKLKKLGLYEYRITGWQGHNSSAAKAKQESQRLKHKKKPQRQAQQSLGLNLTGSLNSPPSEKKEPQTHTQHSLGLNKPDGSLNKPDGSLNKPSEEAESLEKLGVSIALQTYTDLIHTFSEGEREKFLNFCKRQADKLPVPVTMIRSWIGKHGQELLEMYKESTGQIDIQGKEKRSAGVDSDEELINQALESGEIEKYDMGCKMVRYPGTKWWTDVDEFLASKRESQSSSQLPVTSDQLPVTEEEAEEAEEITETPRAEGEFVLPDFKLKTLNRSAQRIIEEALRNGEIEAHDQVNGMVKKAGDRWWTYTNDFLTEKRGSS